MRSFRRCKIIGSFCGERAIEQLDVQKVAEEEFVRLRYAQTHCMYRLRSISSWHSNKSISYAVLIESPLIANGAAHF